MEEGIKNLTLIFVISILILNGDGVQGNSNKSASASQIKTETDLLDFYRQYSSFTDPG